MSRNINHKAAFTMATGEQAYSNLARSYLETRTLLQRIYWWDMMDLAADGKFWRGEIEKIIDDA